MDEELELIFDQAKESMSESIDHLKAELAKIRAGRANPSMLDGVKVEYYGSLTPLNQVSNVNTPDGRTISVQPWEKGMLQEIEKAIMNANLGLNPQNNGELIMINIPPLSEERRQQLVKQAKAEGEKSKVSLRNARKEAMDELKRLKNDGAPEDAIKDAEDEVQKITDEHTAKIDKYIEDKEADILKV
ncbi:ribosome recycling factor [Salibacter sp.]|jgi:ribosome recycling factor|uniref:ribosome recycling factor n=1 Tax=Salibacter sp. TaxID=2010995 RepID=UPI002870B1EE|nr:ribosome recycling factor [Salibacter sp.]MDR9399003.1 ribosome recycling factor [Salibacter sp.]MDR9488189.1 ribosome recycling factor [Salibacter sp.]